MNRTVPPLICISKAIIFYLPQNTISVLAIFDFTTLHIISITILVQRQPVKSYKMLPIEPVILYYLIVVIQIKLN